MLVTAATKVSPCPLPRDHPIHVSLGLSPMLIVRLALAKLVRHENVRGRLDNLERIPLVCRLRHTRHITLDFRVVDEQLRVLFLSDQRFGPVRDIVAFDHPRRCGHAEGGPEGDD
jgi:hypothetical protein